MDDRIRSNLPLLKKLERARLRDLCDSIEEERQPSFDKPLQRAKQKQALLWEWQADDGTWQPFEKDEQSRLEQASQSGQKTIPFLDSIHFMQTVDLTCMQIVNMRTGTGKRIRRTPELDFLISYDIHRTSKRFSGRENRFSCNGWNFDLDDSDKEDVTTTADRTYGTLDWELFSSGRRRSRIRANASAYEDGLDVLGESGLLSTVSTPRASEWSRYGERRSATRDIGSRNYVEVGKTSMKKTVTKSHRATSMRGRQLQPRMERKLEENNKMKQWLSKIQLDEYREKFKREKITLKEVHTLDEEDLKKLGLPMGARKRFLESVKEIKTKREPPNEYLCPITMTTMKDPVILSDGFTYERCAIEQWLKANQKSPMTNQTLENENLTPNRQLKKLIEDFNAFKIDH